MARIARLVVPHYPHHITQRGNRRQRTFFTQDDYLKYIELLVNSKSKAGIEIWAYCLMPNHVHLVAFPMTEDSIAKLFGEAHRRYTRRINFREGWRGHLWQERFHSSVMDENYLIATVRYIELNPVRAGLCRCPEDWTWSSIHAHLKGEDDALVNVRPMLDRVNNWSDYLSTEEQKGDFENIRMHTKTGRPIGNNAFLDQLEQLTGRCLRKSKPGPKSGN